MNYAEQSPKFESLSGVIRTAVEQHISDGSSPDETAADRDIEELQARLDSIQETLRSIESGHQEDDLDDFAHDVFAVLHEIPKEEGQAAAAGTKAGFDPQTTYALSQKLGTTPRRVEEAIEYLEDHHFPIVEYELYGETHFFKTN
jgi:hypothetical protein